MTCTLCGENCWPPCWRTWDPKTLRSHQISFLSVPDKSLIDDCRLPTQFALSYLFDPFGRCGDRKMLGLQGLQGPCRVFTKNIRGW